MNQKTLVVLALLLAAGAVAYLLASGETLPTDDIAAPELRRGSATGRPRSPTRAQTNGVVTPVATQRVAAQNPVGPAAGVSPIGLRVPEGMDLSDPEQVKELLQARLAELPTDWTDVARLVGLLQEPLEFDTRARLLKELVGGQRGLVVKVFEQAQDPTLAGDLLALLDDEATIGQVRSAVLTALAGLPGADPEVVVRGLEARLSGDVRADAMYLQAIGSRGGAEAARAITAYIAASEDPLAVAAHGTLRLDLKGDPAAGAVVAAALRETRSTEALGALIRLATQPGATSVVESLTALDTANVDPEMRGAALRALAVIGTEDAVGHVLETANGNDDLALMAIRSLGVMTAADVGARAKLLESLANPSAGVHAEAARLETLRALATLKHVPAKEAFAEALGDRDPEVQAVGVRGLGRIGEQARDRVDDLLAVFASGSEALQSNVVIALGQIGGDEAVGVLEQLQSREDLPVSVQRALRGAVLRVKEEGGDAREERLGGR